MANFENSAFFKSRHVARPPLDCRLNLTCTKTSINANGKDHTGIMENAKSTGEVAEQYDLAMLLCAVIETRKQRDASRNAVIDCHRRTAQLHEEKRLVAAQTAECREQLKGLRAQHEHDWTEWYGQLEGEAHTAVISALQYKPAKEEEVASSECIYTSCVSDGDIVRADQILLQKAAIARYEGAIQISEALPSFFKQRKEIAELALKDLQKTEEYGDVVIAENIACQDQCYAELQALKDEETLREAEEALLAQVTRAYQGNRHIDDTSTSPLYSVLKKSKTASTELTTETGVSATSGSSDDAGGHSKIQILQKEFNEYKLLTAPAIRLGKQILLRRRELERPRNEQDHSVIQNGNRAAHWGGALAHAAYLKSHDYTCSETEWYRADFGVGFDYAWGVLQHADQRWVDILEWHSGMKYFHEFADSAATTSVSRARLTFAPNAAQKPFLSSPFKRAFETVMVKAFEWSVHLQVKKCLGGSWPIPPMEMCQFLKDDEEGKQLYEAMKDAFEMGYSQHQKAWKAQNK